MGRAEDALLLGVDGHADAEALKAAFRLLALQLHPDVAGEDRGAEFVRIREAYERLRDGHWDKVPVEVEAAEPAVEEVTPRRERAGLGPDFIDLFDNALGNLGRTAARRRVLDHIELEVPLDYLIFGASLSLYVPVEMECRTCRGRGVTVEMSGAVNTCPKCYGERVAERQIKVPINLPPGLRAGNSLRIPLDAAGLKGYDVLVELSLAAIA
jgi:molecular chaperone DnaJ